MVSSKKRKSGSAQGLVKQIYGDEYVSRKLWVTALFLTGMGLIFLVIGLFKNMFALSLSFPAIPGLLMIAWGFPSTIQADPPFVGLLKIWDQRTTVVLRSGKWFLANFYPFYISVIRIPVAFETKELSFDTLCKAEKIAGDSEEETKDSIGTTVDMKIAITLAPDYKARDEDGKFIGGKRLIEFLNMQRLEGVLKTLTGMVKEQLRDVALDYTWEQLVELKNVLSAYLISLVTNKKVGVLPRNADNSAMSIKQLEEAGITPETYERKVTDFYHHLLRDYVATMGFGDTPKDDAKREVLDADILYFLESYVVAGVADVRKLGVFITRFNSEHIFPTGAAAEAAAKTSAEKQERLGEERDTDTDIILARKYLKVAKRRGETMTLEAALKIVRINRGRAKEVQISGTSGNDIKDAAAIVRS
ncbi:MAG TPA: hypothetical protein VHB93_00850 [Candidatus Paceibacterota bacterium]|nr:hypothetical protein [Candidatus Paceibacterota bacterium]